MNKKQKTFSLILLLSASNGYSKQDLSEKITHAWQDTETYQQETVRLQKHEQLVKNEIEEKKVELKHAKEALFQAQEALYIRENVAPINASETFVDKVEEVTVAGKNMIVGTAKATKDAVVDVAH